MTTEEIKPTTQELIKVKRTAILTKQLELIKIEGECQQLGVDLRTLEIQAQLDAERA